jgi:hypothetical protein
MVSSFPHRWQFGSNRILDLYALLLVQTVRFTIWKAVSRIFDVMIGSRNAWYALLKTRWDGRIATTTIRNVYLHFCCFVYIDKRKDSTRYIYVIINWTYENKIYIRD